MPRLTPQPNDSADIQVLVATFFDAFTSGADVNDRLDRLAKLFLPEAVIVRTCGAEPLVQDVGGFIAPRRALLSGGSLVDFREWPTSGRTEVFGAVAHHWGTYAKSWVQDGQPCSGRGAKTLQLVRTMSGWRISALAWDDEPSG